MVGVSGMGWRSGRARKRALACIAVLGAGGIAGLAAGLSADPVQTSELSPAEIVALRFPGGASRMASIHASIHIAPIPIASNHSAAPTTSAETEAAPAPAGYMLASAAESDVSSLMFSPFPTYSSSAHSSPANAPMPAPAPRPSVARQLPAELATASVEIPAQALAYAVPGADEPADAEEPVAQAARPGSGLAASAAAKRPVQPPQPPHPAGPPSPSNAVLNSAQIASIKERLKLTSYQSQLWPPVESALRDISYQGRPDASGRKLASNAKGGAIDPNSVPVQRLKSAAFPLIMSLSEDQKQEVRTMVRLMGLENLAAQF
jgi:hypothetical protein